MNGHQRHYERLRRDVGRRYGTTGQHLLDDAYEIAVVVHAGQRRLSGDPYIAHPVAVAQIVLGLHQPLVSICAALLHDIPDELHDLRGVRERVGDDVVDLVEQSYGLGTHDIPMDFKPAPELRAAFFIKLADRLHNARTWRHVPPARVCVKAQQTLAHYAPVAAALGLQLVADEFTARCQTALDTQGAQPQGEPNTDAQPPLAGDGFVPGGLSGRLLGKAVLLLPARERHRYFEEWVGELFEARSSLDRVRMAAGLNFSALVLRREHRPAQSPREQDVAIS